MRRRDVAALAVLVGVCATYLALLGLQQLWTVRATTYDLVIYDQGIRSYSRFEAPAAISMGVRSGLGAGFTLLGDHFSPVLALLAPLYWIHDGPATLVVAQGVLLAAAIVPVWVIARREVGTGAAYLVAVAYAISWPVLKAAAFDFHEVAFAPLLTAVLLQRFSAWRRGSAGVWQVVVAGLAVACVKEDMGLLLAGFGLAVLAGAAREARPRTRLALGSGFVLGGLAWTAAMTAVIVPALGGPRGADWHYDQFGETPATALRAMASNPGEVLHQLVTPDAKLVTLLMLVMLSVFVGLLSPYVLMIVPLLAARFLAAQVAWWLPEFHYNAFLVVPMLVAGVDGIARISRLRQVRHRRAVILTWAVLTALTAAAVAPTWGNIGVLSRDRWTRTAHTEAGLRAVATVPDAALVEAPNGLGPQLSARTTVLLLDWAPRGAPWVIVDTSYRQFPFCSLAAQRERVDELRAAGYAVVGQDGGFVVLHDPTATPDLDSRVAPEPCS